MASGTCVVSLAISLLALIAASCLQQSAASEVYTDKLSGLTVTKPRGWHMENGDTLRKHAEEEARRLGDPKLAASPKGAPWEPMLRITRYAPGQAPGPNPTIVVTRFDLGRFPPGTSADDLLRMGVASAKVEEEPTTVGLAGRQWRKLTALRSLSQPSGVTIEAVQQVYVTTGTHWAIGLTISAVRDQYDEYQTVFNTFLGSMTFK